jgi:hypothetical protein
MVPNGVLEDALEQQGQFFGWPMAVLVRKLEHGILNDIQCHILVPDGEQRLLEGPALDAGQKVGKFCAGSQGRKSSDVFREFGLAQDAAPTASLTNCIVASKV